MKQTDDVLGGSGWDENAHPAIALDLRIASFSHGRNIRQNLRARFARNCKRTHVAFFDLRNGCGGRAEADRSVPSDDRGNRRAAAIEGDVHEIEAERKTELLAGEMGLRASPRRSVTVFAGISSNYG